MKYLAIIAVLPLLAGLPHESNASSGQEGASFLDIPIGARPAALGSAYTALADDAYAPTWNPGGLGFLESTQLAAQHLSYLESIHYEYLSIVHPLQKGRSLGASIQYLGTGDMTGFDHDANPQGNFSSHWVSYNLALGQAISQHLSLGITAKMIQAKIDDVAANAYAADVGGQYRVNDYFKVAAVLANIGTKLTFLNEGDPLPMAFRLGAACQPLRDWKVAVEGVYRKNGPMSGHFGVEWEPLPMITLRAGYRTDTLKMLSSMAGLTVGTGIDLWGQELAYAWLPYGELGNTHYLSLVMRFGEAERARRNLIHYHHQKMEQEVRWMGVEDPRQPHAYWQQPEEVQLMQLMSETNPEVARAPSPAPAPEGASNVSRSGLNPDWTNLQQGIPSRREQIQ